MTVKLITGSAQDGIHLDVVSSTQGQQYRNGKYKQMSLAP